MLIAQCAGSCWEAEVMLSSSSPCPPEPHQGRCGRAEQEHSKAGSSSSATVPLKLLRREFLAPLVSEERSRSRTRFCLSHSRVNKTRARVEAGCSLSAEVVKD